MLCPVCRADNEPTTTCRRCKADLSLMLAIDRQQAEYIQKFAQSIVADDQAAALAWANAAHQTKADSASLRAKAVAALCFANYREAFFWYSLATANEDRSASNS